MPETRGPARRLDPVGVLLSCVGLTTAVYVIIERRLDWVLIAVAVAALVAFVLWERRREEPMLPLFLFRERNFTGASMSILLMAFGAGAVMFMLTQYLQFVLGYAEIRAGLAMLPYAVAAAIFNGVGAGLGKKLGNRALVSGGLLVMAAGFVIMANAAGYPALFTALLLMGVGGGLAGPSAYASLMNAIPIERAGVGSAMNDTVQQVGLALSIAVLGSVLAGVYTGQMPASAPDAARESIGVAIRLPELADAAGAAFTTAMHVGSWVGAAFCVAASVVAAALLRPEAPAPAQEPAPV